MTDLNQSFPASARLVILRLSNGDTVRGVTESLGGSRTGLYLVPVDCIWYRRIFVLLQAIRDVVSSHPVEQYADSTGTATLASLQRAFLRESAPKPLASGSNRGSGTNQAFSEQHREYHLPAAGAARHKLGAVLVERGFLCPSELEQVIERQGGDGEERLGQVAIAMGFATHRMIAIALAMQYGVPFIDLGHQCIGPRLRRLITPDFARRWKVIPIGFEQGLITIAVADPTDPRPVSLLRRDTGIEVARVVASRPDIDRAITRHFPV